MRDMLEETLTITSEQLANRLRFIQELRTTNLTQGRNAFYDNGRYCAYGVYLECVGQIGVYMMIGWTQSCFGFTHSQTTTVMQMNDLQDKTFLEIADYIESLPI